MKFVLHSESPESEMYPANLQTQESTIFLMLYSLKILNTHLVVLLGESVSASFNRVNVDGDMSTNDTVLILANGVSGVKIEAGTPAAESKSDWSANILHQSLNNGQAPAGNSQE